MLNFKPEKVWYYFGEITKLPRCSGNEDAIRNWVIDVANTFNLDSCVDHYGNVKICKSGTEDCKGSAGLILQAHLDMVCEPKDSIKFPLDLVVDKGWAKAKGTTLGADDGIGVALALSVLTSDNIKHPPLEVLFTVEEETGLNGAMSLEEGFVTYKRLINLDSEEEGSLIIGGAGGGNSTIILPLKWEKNLQEKRAMSVLITGLKGGHSGINIHERPNAIKFLSELLNEIKDNLSELQLIDIKGGTRHNVIPNEASAAFIVKNNCVDIIKNKIVEYSENLKRQWLTSEPNLKISLNEIDLPDKVLSKEISEKILNLLYELPSGVISWSKDFANVVQTSTNLATVAILKDKLEIVQSTRSLEVIEIEKIRSNIEKIAKKNNANCFNDRGYPAWTPNPNSILLETAKRLYHDLYAVYPKVEVIHGGLETGIILDKFPGIDMISIGPTMKNVHSIDEQLYIQSVEKVHNYLIKLIETNC